MHMTKKIQFTCREKNVVYFMIGQALENAKPDAVFKYSYTDILGQVTEIKTCPEGMTFNLNVGRCNGKTTRNAEEVFKKKMKLYFDNKPVEIVNEGTIFKLCPSPKKIIFSGPKCIVLWTDNTKTIVSCGENDNWDEYAAYCAALAKKIYGTTSAVHRLVNKKSNVKEYKEAKELSEKVISHITPPDPFNDIRKENDNDR